MKILRGSYTIGDGHSVNDLIAMNYGFGFWSPDGSLPTHTPKFKILSIDTENLNDVDEPWTTIELKFERDFENTNYNVLFSQYIYGNTPAQLNLSKYVDRVEIGYWGGNDFEIVVIGD